MIKPLKSVFLVGLSVLPLTIGCQQRMAEQPAPRPYEKSAMFEDSQSARPLERGTVHRGQYLEDDPMVTWLTKQGKSPKADAEWAKLTKMGPNTQLEAGVPSSVDNFVDLFPFEMTIDDLQRGQKLFNAVCAECHGAAGYGNGKIVERGYLKPPSYHIDPAGKRRDAAHLNEVVPENQRKELPFGYSRGFDRWGIQVPLSEVPVGYIFQVITWGYGGMGSHEIQVVDPRDRWRVIAYIRALQKSQNADNSGATPEKPKPAEESK